ncbi:MAG: DNA polymerase III subunit delta [Oligoflexia bacterium]|nr:DNA polymerase III subunit delta [Oligoflexia bacterium]
MASIDSRRLSQEIDQGKFHSLYLLVGDEVFMIDEVLERLRERVLDGAIADFNLNIFYAADCNIAQVSDAISTLPMMATKRLVIVKEAQEFSANEWESLESLVENPVDTTCVVFVAAKIDSRRRIFKLLEKNGCLVKFQRPYENQVNPWVQYIAKKHGKTIEVEAIEMLKQAVGIGLTDINNEIQKISQFIGLREQITLEDVKKVASHLRVHTVFELANCIGRGDCAGSFTHLAHLLDTGQNEVGVLSMIIRHFRILLLCHEAVREGLSQAQISSRVGVHGFFVREYLDQAKRHEPKHLLHIYDVLLDTERALKSNPLSSHLWLENLILQACRPGLQSNLRPAL